jgi:pimeloyl-ACP methyl ester carboxylesterase
MNAGERLPGTPAPMHMWSTHSGFRFAGDAWGDPQSPLVLLGHGGGQTRHAWGTTARGLADAGLRAIAYDARGHGDTDWPDDGDYSLDAQIRGLQDLIHALGDRRPALIGASLSAEIFLVAVGEGAVDASALVLVDFAPSTREEGYQRNKAFMEAHAHGFASLEEVADAVASHRGGQRPSRLDGLAKVVRQRADGRFYWHWDPRLIDWRVREYPTRHARMAAAARRLAIPTLLVRGGKSDVLSEEGAREFLELVPHAEYLVIPEAGHMIASDANDRFGAVTLDFLRRNRP